MTPPTEVEALQAKRLAVRSEMKTINSTVALHFEGIQRCNSRYTELENELDRLALQIVAAVKADERARLKADLEEMTAYCGDFERDYKRKRGIE